MRKMTSFSILAMMTLVFCSCGTLLNDFPQTVNIVSDPAGAEVTVDGNSMGKTPVSVTLAPTKDYKIDIGMAGFQTRTITLVKKIGVLWLVVDIICGIIPAVVDIITGEWFELRAFDETGNAVPFTESSITTKDGKTVKSDTLTFKLASQK